MAAKRLSHNMQCSQLTTLLMNDSDSYKKRGRTKGKILPLFFSLGKQVSLCQQPKFVPNNQYLIRHKIIALSAKNNRKNSLEINSSNSSLNF